MTRTRVPKRCAATAFAVVAAASLLTGLVRPSPAAHAAVQPPHDQPDTSTVDPAVRDRLLATGWQASDDVAWTMSGDSDGLHVLAADERSGYTWRTAATLSEPGAEADEWIGNACLTGSGHRLVVAYAPRAFTNKQELFDRGAFTAVVDLTDGSVRKLPVLTSLAYFNPGCGAGETAVLTQARDEDLGQTRLISLDAAAGTLGKPIDVKGQMTSAVPTQGGVVAAGGAGLFRVGADGSTSLLARSAGAPFHIHPDAQGGVVFMDATSDNSARAQRVDAKGMVATVATGKLGAFRVSPAAGGKVFLTGKTDTATGLSTLNVPPDVTLSSNGRLAVSTAGPKRMNHFDSNAVTAPPAEDTVAISATVVATNTAVQFTVSPAARVSQHAGDGRAPGPLVAAAPPRIAPRDDGDNPVDAGFTCAIARNDPHAMAYQPTTRQVEWAVDMLATGHPELLSRPADWQHTGLPAYKPMQVVPQRPLAGGGSIPATILLGILSQESNLWQAAKTTPAGLTGNPLIGNFYGIPFADRQDPSKWAIQFNKADCGYGVAQVTDGMRVGDSGRTPLQQRAIALDYAANIAAGADILADKWNQLYDAGIKLGDGSPSPIEHWYLVAWAYNSGLHPQSDAGKNNGAWGLGWLNNPANPHYPRDRPPFLADPHDASHPQQWPYQEKVIGFAANGIDTTTGPSFKPAWWLTATDRSYAQPANNYEFCAPTTTYNECDSTQHAIPSDPPVVGEPEGPCLHHSAAGLFDLKCWWHSPDSWRQDCPQHCGHGDTRYDPDPVKYPNPPDGNDHPPVCTTAGLPANALVVNSVDNHASPKCAQQPPNNGGFQFNFSTAEAKIDLHQDGGGFGGHYWFAHTWTGGLTSKMRITGTWTLNQPLNQWARVLVHLPDRQAETQQAHYNINLGNGTIKDRYVPQGREDNNWVSLGVYPFAGVPSVTLSNVTQDGTGDDPVSWNSIAFQPLPDKPKYLVAALGDSYSSGEGVSGYYRESDNHHGKSTWNACHRSKDAWPRQMTMPDVPLAIGELEDEFSPSAELSFVACSGAWTNNIQGVRPTSWDHPEQYETGEGQFHEVSQMESGVLDENTTLVTLTAGGNDENGFADAVEDCINPTGLCTSFDGEGAFLMKFEPILNRTQERLKSLIRRIHSTGYAPHAHILLVGYPKLVNPGNACGAMGPVGSTNLSKLAQYMSDQEEKTVEQLRSTEGLPVDFRDALAPFDGHGACATTEYINGGSVGPRTEGDFHAGDRASPLCWPWKNGDCLSRESFHPNKLGAHFYAQAVNEKLRQIFGP